MRHSRLLPLTTRMAICGVFLLFTAPSAAADLTIGEACTLLGDLAALPVEAAAQAAGDCAAILECRFEARQAAGLGEAEESALTMEAACERVGRILSLTGSQARELAEGVGDGEVPGCRQFLDCVAESVAKSGSTPESARHAATPEWKTEFDRICAQVPIAGSLSTELLQQLIVDTGALIATLRESDLPQAKLFIQRLEMCRSFFEYSLELQAEDSDREAEY